MAISKPKLYIGCALTHAPSEFIANVAKFKATLADHFEMLDFLGTDTGTAQDVYNQDIGICIATCDLFVAICDHASMGLGYEIATAVEYLHKPVIAIASRNAVVSRLIQGVNAPHYQFLRYENLPDVTPAILNAKELLTS